MTLSDYVRRRNGVPLGAGDSLRNMLSRSLGAGTFSEFWQYWNPIWGYYLGMYIFKPIKSVLPASLSLLLTFVACGLIHDLAVMLLKWKFSLLLTQWFLFMGLCVIFGKTANINYSKFPWIVRAAINILVISGCFVIANQLNKVVLTIFVVTS
ncbi:MBOAT family O-acyltransferase [Draconibacterium sp. IB214405]|uniref:MBOAT family O-acyltransferase n=1 Tax=Draconibacterium sp. IB214405 TaxID=3097352 RepID=UPI002A15C590|nr:MBOAT family O-acyltransferase [Draconibacterium sp. IB214405]MDX8340240.1 MBOAT family O-acyltransferase [Draconibacterium sp. IB214405]